MMISIKIDRLMQYPESRILGYSICQQTGLMCTCTENGLLSVSIYIQGKSGLCVVLESKYGYCDIDSS